MEKILVRVSVELEVSANRDPRDLAQDVSDAVEQLVIGTIKDVRYNVFSGQLIPETGVAAPKKGVLE